MNPSPYPTHFLPTHLQARITKILLIAGAVASGMLFIAEALSFAFPLTDDQELGENLAGAAIVLVIFLVAIFETLIYLATIVFFLIWLYRAYYNLRAFDRSRRLNYSPGWAVGSFFIPFVNLVVPYRAVKEVWQKSGSPDEGLIFEPSPPAWFPIWWAFWLLASFAGRISMRLSFNENVAESTATMVSMVASALSLIAALFAYVVVDAIDKKQEETIAKLKLSKFPGPPPPPPNLAMGGVVVSTAGHHNPQQS